MDMKRGMKTACRDHENSRVASYMYFVVQGIESQSDETNVIMMSLRQDIELCASVLSNLDLSTISNAIKLCLTMVSRQKNGEVVLRYKLGQDKGNSSSPKHIQD